MVETGFNKLKPICLNLLQSSDQLNEIQTSVVLNQLSDLRNALKLFESHTNISNGQNLNHGPFPFTPSLANYIFFPLSRFLMPSPPSLPNLPPIGPPQPPPQLSPAILESLFLTLVQLCRLWNDQTDAGIDEKTKTQFLILGCLKLVGPPPSMPIPKPQDKEKEKEKETKRVDDELVGAVVDFLTCLLSPSNSREAANLDIPTPILIASLTSLLDIASPSVSEPRPLPLRLKTLDSLHLFLRTFFFSSRQHPGERSPTESQTPSQSKPRLKKPLPKGLFGGRKLSEDDDEDTEKKREGSSFSNPSPNRPKKSEDQSSPPLLPVILPGLVSSLTRTILDSPSTLPSSDNLDSPNPPSNNKKSEKGFGKGGFDNDFYQPSRKLNSSASDSQYGKGGSRFGTERVNSEIIIKSVEILGAVLQNLPSATMIPMLDKSKDDPSGVKEDSSLSSGWDPVLAGKGGAQGRGDHDDDKDGQTDDPLLAFFQQPPPEPSSSTNSSSSTNAPKLSPNIGNPTPSSSDTTSIQLSTHAKPLLQTLSILLPPLTRHSNARVRETVMRAFIGRGLFGFAGEESKGKKNEDNKKINGFWSFVLMDPIYTLDLQQQSLPQPLYLALSSSVRSSLLLCGDSFPSVSNPSKRLLLTLLAPSSKSSLTSSSNDNNDNFLSFLCPPPNLLVKLIQEQVNQALEDLPRCIAKKDEREVEEKTRIVKEGVTALKAAAGARNQREGEEDSRVGDGLFGGDKGSEVKGKGKETRTKGKGKAIGGFRTTSEERAMERWIWSILRALETVTTSSTSTSNGLVGDGGFSIGWEHRPGLETTEGSDAHRGNDPSWNIGSIREIEPETLDLSTSKERKIVRENFDRSPDFLKHEDDEATLGSANGVTSVPGWPVVVTSNTDSKQPSKTQSVAPTLEGRAIEASVGDMITLVAQFLSFSKDAGGMVEAGLMGGSIGVLDMVERFWEIGLGEISNSNPSPEASVSNGGELEIGARAVWMVERLLNGIANKDDGLSKRMRGTTDDEWRDIKEGRKRARKVAKRIIGDVVAILEGEWEEEDDEDGITNRDGDGETQTSTKLTARERSKEEMEDLSVEERRGSHHDRLSDGVATSKNRVVRDDDVSKRKDLLHKQKRERARLSLMISTLQLLSTISQILSTSFRSTLQSTIYPVLKIITSPTSSPTLVTVARTALARIGYQTGYATVGNMLEENLDYLMQAIQSRLGGGVSAAAAAELASASQVGKAQQGLGLRMDLDAPLVLIAIIKAVGDDGAIEMARDVVEDALEMLDDYHGYDIICARIWAVLDEIVRVMVERGEEAADVALTIEGGKKQIREDKRTPAMLAARWTGIDMNEEPNADLDIAGFAEWFSHRNDKHEDEDSSSDSPNGNLEKELGAHSFTSPAATSLPPEEENPQFHEDEDDQPIPATKSQLVLTQILAKAPYFLSHPSSVLRARLLSLVATSVPLLSAEERRPDLLPLIHKMWPYVVNRLSIREEPFVLLNAAKLIESLARSVGDFMSRRTVDDVWPKFRQLLKERNKIDSGASKAAGGSGGSGTIPGFGTSYALFQSMLETMTVVLRDVPVNEEVRWEMTILFRQFVKRGVKEEVRKAAKELYKELARLNLDGVWLGLEGAVGRDKLPAFLKLDGWDGDTFDSIL